VEYIQEFVGVCGESGEGCEIGRMGGWGWVGRFVGVGMVMRRVVRMWEGGGKVDVGMWEGGGLLRLGRGWWIGWWGSHEW